MKEGRKMETPGNRKAISPVVAVIILIAVAVSASIVVAAWMGVLTFTFIATDEFDVEIGARIYSPQHNIGVLNEDGEFNISIKNLATSTRAVNVILVANENILFNETVAVESGSLEKLYITQKLIYSGSWRIEVTTDKDITEGYFKGKVKAFVDGYSFITLTNEAEADWNIVQLHNMNLNTNISIVSLLISILSMIVSTINIIYVKKRHIRNSGEVSEKMESIIEEDKEISEANENEGSEKEVGENEATKGRESGFPKQLLGFVELIAVTTAVSIVVAWWMGFI